MATAVSQLADRVLGSLVEARRRCAINAAASMVLTLVELGLSVSAAVAMAWEDATLATALNLVAASAVAVDAALRTRESTGMYHSQCMQLTAVSDRLRLEAQGRKPHHLRDEYDEIMKTTPPDLLVAALELCWPRKPPEVARVEP